MSFSFIRNKFVAKKLGNLNGEKILDIGCRDKIFEKYLEGKYEYTGIDFDPDKPPNIEISDKKINYNLEKVYQKTEFDIINALDVLEHLENIHNYLMKFLLNQKKVSIALPNMGYYKFRLNFLFKGTIGGNIHFMKKVYDRHRWLPNYSILNLLKTTIRWMESQKFDFIAERKETLYFIT